MRSDNIGDTAFGSDSTAPDMAADCQLDTMVVDVHNRHIEPDVAIAIAPSIIVPGLLIAGDSVWPSVLAYHALCIGAPLASRCSFNSAGLVVAELRAWLPVSIVLSLLLVAVGAVLQLLNLQMFLPDGWQDVLSRVDPWWTFVLYSLTVNPFLEEYFWRGYLLPKTGIFPGAGFFWLMHLAGLSVFLTPFDAICYTVPAFAAAVAWGRMRSRFRTLWPCIITHTAVDVAIIWLASGLRG